MNKAISTISSMITMGAMLFSSIPVGAATIYDKGETSATGTFNVEFSQQDTIELTVSDNLVSFGNVNMLTESQASNVLTTVIRSSKAYDLTAIANEDFKSKTDETAATIPVSKLSVKVDDGSYSNFEKGNSKLLISEAAPYSTGSTHTVSFQIASTIGYQSGDYSVPITITATQK